MTSPEPGAHVSRLPPGSAPREIIARDPQRSFRSLRHDFPSEVCGWAAHPEYEIHLIAKSSGSMIAGDYVGTFGAGHVSMMGPMLAHDWVSDLAPGEVVRDRDALVHFSDEWIRDCMTVMPELHRIERLLTRSSRGLEFTGDTAQRAAYELNSVIDSSGPEQIAHMFALLGVLADGGDEESHPLASEWQGTSDDANANAAVEAGLAYIFDNLTGDVRLSIAAGIAHMSDSTFSKYFKAGAGMPFSQMVKRLRIHQARRLLDTTELTTARVAAASGYQNLSNFNRQFLSEVGIAPSAYRKLGIDEKPPVPPTRNDALGRSALG
ncbi:MAG: AraC family transcriptional regulator [Aquihabitans sp.]